MIIFHCLINHNYLYVQVSIILGGTYILLSSVLVFVYSVSIGTVDNRSGSKVTMPGTGLKLLEQWVYHESCILLKNLLII